MQRHLQTHSLAAYYDAAQRPSIIDSEIFRLLMAAGLCCPMRISIVGGPSVLPGTGLSQVTACYIPGARTGVVYNTPYRRPAVGQPNTTDTTVWAYRDTSVRGISILRPRMASLLRYSSRSPTARVTSSFQWNYSITILAIAADSLTQKPPVAVHLRAAQSTARRSDLTGCVTDPRSVSYIIRVWNRSR